MTATFSRRASTLIGCSAAFGVASVGFVAAPASAAPSVTPFISEIHYDNDGTDVGEFVEVQAAAGTDLSGWQVVLYNGSNGAAYSTRAVAAAASTGHPSGDGVAVLEYPANGIQNGAPDGVALVSPAGDVVEFLSYEGTMTAVGGAAAGLTSTDIGVAEEGTTPVGFSLQRMDPETWEGPLAETRGQVNAATTGGGEPEPTPDPAPEPGPAPVPGDGDVFISEFHYDNSGVDVGERVEVQAPVGTDLTGYLVVPYNGNGGVTYDVQTLSGTVTAPEGDTSGNGVVVVDVVLQNGAPDGLALVDPDGRVLEFLSYEGVFDATNGPAAGQTSVDVGVEQGGDTPVGASLQLVAGVWAAYDRNTFGQVNATAGGGGPAPEPAPVPELCDLTPTSTIGAVQGSGAETPFAGQQVTLRGTVTSDTPGLRGFTIQDAGDGDPATSDGIFVFSDTPDVALGDVVVVQGPATEFSTVTQVSAQGQVEICSSGATLPEAVVLPMPSTDEERERFEGMVVTITDELTVTGAFGLEQYGEVRVSVGGVLVTPTEAALPGAPAAAVEAENQTREITIDDGSTASNPRPVPYLTVEDSVRIGDTVDELGRHVLSYGFDQWRLQPVTGSPDQVEFADTNPRTASAEDVGGDIQVGAYNVLNYFVTLTSENSQARGAATAEDFQLQQAKIVSGILGLGADVVGLQEIEYGVRFGKDADVAVAALTAALNAADDEGEWDYVRTPDYVRDTPDVIQNAIIYRSDVVEPVGESMTGGVSDPEAWSNAREPVAQTFVGADGDELTVVVNHFKSKSGGGATGANADTGDGQGAYNADRVRQATALAAFADTLSAQDPDVFLVGDFNAYGQEDPIRVLRDAGYVDVLAEEEGYTYTFDQRNGNLDHILVNAEALPKITGADIWEVNAAEPFAYQYSSGIPSLHAPYAYRASDHNPSVVGFDAQPSPPAEPPLGRDVSLGDVLRADASGPEKPNSANGDDYDILLALVQRVLAAKPGSELAVLLDPTVEVTAFLPDDDAFISTPLLPGNVRNENAVVNRITGKLSVDELERLLLGHVVPGRTLELSDLLASDGASLVTAAGTTLVVDVRADGRVAIIDQARGNRDALLVLDAADVNLGQVQVGHTVDRVLQP